MNELTLFRVALVGMFACAAVTAVALLKITAPYGRHVRRGFGATMSSTGGWVLMEAVSALGMPAMFLLGDRTADPVALAFLGLWEIHYLHRAFVFPLRRKGGARPMPISVVAMAIAFNGWNVYLNGRWLFALGPTLNPSWLCDPRFLAGAALFLSGMAINIHSDNVLIRLRRPGELEYRIPRGGLYRFVTMPNYLGELVEWLAWALATWSLAGLAFAVFTAANLVPRAISNHRWYVERFPDYPKERRALIPFVL
jgi:3-oxo-5-alpha-steroid 4-dehydrogenase 1